MEIKPNHQTSFTFSEAQWIATGINELPTRIKQNVQQARREFCSSFFPQGYLDEASLIPLSVDYMQAEMLMRDTEMDSLADANFKDTAGIEKHVIHVDMDQPALIQLLAVAQNEYE